jgi:type I restriction enzyme S subunit
MKTTSEKEQRKRRPYPKYKPSGVEWLGEIPAYWALKPLKRTFRILNGSTPKSGEAAYWNGDIPWATPDDLGDMTGATLEATRRMITREGYESCGTSMAPAGSLVLSTRAPIGHLAIAGVAMCANQGCRCLAFRNLDDNRFFYFQLLSAKQELESLGEGSTFRELSRDRLAAIILASPPAPEQRAIAAFLERETARIDALIEKKQRQIELLQEKRAALITHAVTKGLNPKAPMKDSGAEWLGQIPAHWDVVHLKRVLCKCDYGISENLNASGHYGVLRMGDLQDGELVFDNLGYVNDVPVDLILEHNDLVFNRTNSLALVGKVAIFRGVPADRVCFASYLVRLRVRISSNPEYFCFFLNCPEILAKVSSMALPAIGQANLNPTRYGYLRVCVPSKEEQDRIVVYLNEATKSTDRLSKTLRSGIETLREYRTALISAAVTGKIDVR